MKQDIDLCDIPNLSKTMRICARQRCPEDCPRNSIDIDGAECARCLFEDAADVLDVQQVQLETLIEENTQIKSERDYLEKFIPHSCETCRNWDKSNDTPPYSCKIGGCPSTKWENWQWAGIRKEEENG